jgi:hypothetical protein
MMPQKLLRLFRTLLRLWAISDSLDASLKAFEAVLKLLRQLKSF